MNAISRRLALTLAAGAITGIAVSALGQEKTLKEQIVGTWSFVSAYDVHADGSKTDRWGRNPKGMFMFDRDGRFVQMISRSDIAPFAAKRVDQGTPAEYKAVMVNVVASFGTYTVNEAERTVTTTVEGSLFPNLVGVAQKRRVMSLSASELKYSNPATTMGTTAEATWRRAALQN
jgi:Lipocalin-like domain